MGFFKKRERVKVKGKFFFLSAVILLIGIGGVNSGENQVLFFFALTLAAVGVSGFFARRNLERIEIKVSQVGRVFCCEETLIPLEIKNKRFYPRFALWIRKEEQDTFVGDIPSRSTRSFPLRHKFKRRGYNSLPPLILWSEFPIGMVVRERKFLLPEKILVYPKIYNVKPYFPEEIMGEGEDRPDMRGNEEVHYVREVEEAEPRKIYWKGLARTGKLMEKMMGGSFGERIIIALDPYGSGPSFEENISLIASLGYYLWKNRIFHFLFAGNFQDEVNEKNLDSFMTSLALMKPGTREDSEQLASTIKKMFPRSTVFLALSSDDSPMKHRLNSKELVFIK